MTLHLLPNLLGDEANPDQSFVPALFDIIDSLQGFYVENAKDARKWLKNFDFPRHRDKPMEIVDKRTENFSQLLDPVKEGQSWGLVSSAGVPCIADPGAKLVRAAEKRGIEVLAYPGPCSIILALMLSGFDAQQFVFGGYIPRHLQADIKKEKRTQIYIETPFRNQKTLHNLMEVLSDQDELCVACDLMLESQEVVSQPIKKWKGSLSQYDFHKRPAIFLIKTA